jgi:DNA-binding transcriptional MerR regulator
MLKPSRRSGSNYRLYSDEDVHRLRFIRAAQATGFALDDIRQLLRPAPCSKVQELIEHRLKVVEARMRGAETNVVASSHPPPPSRSDTLLRRSPAYSTRASTTVPQGRG